MASGCRFGTFPL